jgi:hypothetical protein
VKWPKEKNDFETWTRIKGTISALARIGIPVTWRQMLEKRRKDDGSYYKNNTRMCLFHYLQLTSLVPMNGKFTNLSHDVLICLKGQSHDGTGDGMTALFVNEIEPSMLDTWKDIYEDICTIATAEKDYQRDKRGIVGPLKTHKEYHMIFLWQSSSNILTISLPDSMKDTEHCFCV